jgi:hypothetical protein
MFVELLNFTALDDIRRIENLGFEVRASSYIKINQSTRCISLSDLLVVV